MFSGISSQCSACHAGKEPHGGQFSKTGEPQKDCSRCHIPVSWANVTFDHSHTRFVPNGPHQDLACVKCHKEQSTTDGKVVRMYRDTPTDCLKCH